MKDFWFERNDETDVLHEAHTLVMQLAPELRQSPLYVMPAGDYPLPQQVDAIAEYRINAAWRAKLEAAGQWRGNGHLIVLTNNVLELPREQIIGIVSHEVSHLLPYAAPLDCPETSPESVRASLAHAVDLATLDNPAPTTRPWGIWHGRDFHRIAAHLWYRATGVGCHMHPDSMRAGDWLGLPKLGVFIHALGDELTAMETATFTEILNTPLPPFFAWLWEQTTKE